MSQGYFSNKTKNINRVRGGRIAKKSGEFWEMNLFTTSRRQGYEVVQIPSGGRWTKMQGTLKFIPTKTPFDFIIIEKGGKSVFIDSKSYDKNRISRSDLESHQITSLLFLNEHNCTAGYLVYFKPIDKIVYFSAKQLANLNSGEGLGLDDGLLLGTSFEFDISKLFNAPS